MKLNIKKIILYTNSDYFNAFAKKKIYYKIVLYYYYRPGQNWII